MVDGINKVSSGLGDGALSKAVGGDGLGQEAFLKLLVAQLQNQDPLNPQENSEFVAQLAQFSSLEAAMGTNTRLDTLATQNQGMANTEVVGLVGKIATVKGSLVTATGSGTAVPVGFTLGAETASTTVSIQNASGKVIRTIPVGPHAPGLVKVNWDGRDDQGNIMPAGTYAVSVQAKDGKDNAVSVAQETTGLVKSVAFDKGYPVLTLANGMQVPVSDLLKVDSSP